MAKTDFFTILEEEMDKHFQYDYAFNWDKKNRTLEVSFILDVQNAQGIEVIDQAGEDTATDIAFEDAVLFYDISKSHVNAEEYLTLIPFDAKRGLSREFLAYFAQFLNDTATQGLDDLMDFLNDPGATDFEIIWQDEQFEKGLDNLSFSQSEHFSYPRF